LSAGIKANVDGSAAIQVGGTDVITLTSGGAATFVTSPTTVQAGTAAAPSITTSGDTNTGIFFPAADTIAFAEGGAEALRINSSGTVVLSGGDTSANGTGITFPATQSASSNANTLDDYEEGAWTPTLPNGGTLSVTSARYVKIGQQVTVSFYVTSVAPTNNGSQFRIGGLPFAGNSTSGLYFGGSFGYVGDSNLSGWLPITGVSLTYIYFQIQGNSDARSNAQYLTAASGSVDAFIITLTYFTD